MMNTRTIDLLKRIAKGEYFQTKNIKFEKTALHFALVFSIESENSGNFPYKLDHDKWPNNSISTTNLLQPIIAKKRYINLLCELDYALNTRIHEWEYYGIKGHIGIYECSCGLVYKLDNCGSVVDGTEVFCEDCGLRIGG